MFLFHCSKRSPHDDRGCVYRNSLGLLFFFFNLFSLFYQAEQMRRCNRRHYLWAVRSRGFATLASPYGEPQQEDSGYGRGEGNSAKGVTGGACGLVCNTVTHTHRAAFHSFAPTAFPPPPKCSNRACQHPSL